LLGHEIANVAIALIANGADTVNRLVDAVAGTESERTRRVGLRTKKNAALHSPRSFHTRQRQRRGSQGGQADYLILDAAWAKVFWRGEVSRPTNNHRHTQAAVVTVMDAARFEPAVVGKKDHDGVIFKAVRPQRLKHFANALIHAGNRVQVACPFLAGDGMI